jgi:NAD(P)-dependent dehydrogenase (short-subunit alcohol dehydrogenase family)
MKDLKDRVAVVTGAATGMGRSIALALAQEGVDVVISDIDLDEAEKVRDEVRALGRRSIAVHTDVADRASVAKLADQAYAEFGRVDILVNNAGVTLRPYRAVWDTSYEDFRWVFDINVMGVINGVLAFVPRMRAQPGEKHIVNTSSMGTLVKVPGHSAYAASKAAVNGFSDIIREELEPDNFGVTILFPGYVKTRIGTSERLRPEADRSDNRQVTPFSEIAARNEAQGYKANSDIAGAVQLKDSGEITRGIEADGVGAMVVKAILANEPYCMTHPTPAEGMRRHTEELIRAYL